MTSVLPELRGLPERLVLDGELVAWRNREPYFPLVCRRVLPDARRPGVSRSLALGCAP